MGNPHFLAEIDQRTPPRSPKRAIPDPKDTWAWIPAGTLGNNSAPCSGMESTARAGNVCPLCCQAGNQLGGAMPWPRALNNCQVFQLELRLVLGLVQAGEHPIVGYSCKVWVFGTEPLRPQASAPRWKFPRVRGWEVKSRADVKVKLSSFRKITQVT